MLLNLIQYEIKNKSCAGWEEFFANELQKAYFMDLNRNVTEAAAHAEIFPPQSSIFHAYTIAPEKIKCVIIGQDPYHESGQAMGLAFSVKNDFPAPPSLKNIKKELADDLTMKYEIQNDLSCWVKQGVFLINTALTVEKGKAGSHSTFGWKTFVENSLTYICESSDAPLCAILWGKHAQGFKPVFLKTAQNRPVHIIESAHPSPLSVYRGFWGSKPFSKANEFLKANGSDEIDWYCASL